MHFKLIFFSLLLLLSSGLSAQLLTPEELDTCKVYTSLEDALQEPELVYRLKLSRQKLTQFPEDIAKLKNLQELDLTKNKLKSLPDSVALPYLQRLNLSKNQLDEFPAVICTWNNLKELTLNQNELQALPAAIGRLKKLEYLDLWSNDLGIYPSELKELTALKELDLRVIQLSASEQQTIRSYLPQTKIYFSPSCNCGN